MQHYVWILRRCIYVCVIFLLQPNSGADSAEDGVRGAGYTPIIKENDRFVKYYQVGNKTSSPVISIDTPSLVGSGTDSGRGMGPVHVRPSPAVALHVQDHRHPPCGHRRAGVSAQDVLSPAESGPAGGGAGGGVSPAHSTVLVCQ